MLYDVIAGKGEEERAKRKAPGTSAKGATRNVGDLRSEATE